MSLLSPALLAFAAGVTFASLVAHLRRKRLARVRSPRVFKLERFFAKYEFNAKHQLCNSDVSALSVKELLKFCVGDTAGIRAWEDLSLGYTESQGHPELLVEIAKTYDAGIEPSDILECVPAEGILLCTQALVGVGDTCIVTWPAYQSLYEIACSRGAEVRFWRARGGGPQRLRFDVRDLVAEVQAVQRTGGAVKMILINFPHNPTGCSLSPAELEQVVRIARGCGAYLIGDEMYRGLEYEGNRPLPAVCELYEKGVSLSGMSKVYALPGLRLGWLASRDPSFIAEACKLKDYTTICGSAPSELLALLALRQRKALLARSQRIVANGLVALEAFVANHPGLLHYHRPDAGPICYPSFQGEGLTSTDVLRYVEALVEETGVLLLPGGVCYEIEDGNGRGALATGVRLGFGRLDCASNLAVYDAAMRDERFCRCVHVAPSSATGGS